MVDFNLDKFDMNSHDYDMNEVEGELHAAWIQGGNNYIAILKSPDAAKMRFLQMPNQYLKPMLYTIEKTGHKVENIALGENSSQKWQDKTERQMIKAAKKGTFIQKFGKQVELEFDNGKV